MKLKVGMYVRTKEGRIDKIEEILDKEKAGSSRIIRTVESEKDYFFGYEEWTDLFPPCHFIKASENIIDLIEEGDYVNGYRVTYVYPNLIKVDSTDIWEIHSHDIKSIITKEQFNSVKYEVE
nr:MAG TPA: hypothetical protein [Caudoviricetes sp.]